ncbi:porin family protein [Rhodanobacter sp. 7MK24]|uniref:outer membrane beta-barrel protein n=1 Tax=Rhodanobacter sp. 7MK24 TaxID=2775922 RepID=UPI00178117F8|nr:outer membrane beta-barrel protein [Rhodanobacter sp. 7MK24]MBD8881253.1 porin family protein [Rhodanobacter sp. 7MK24]
MYKKLLPLVAATCGFFATAAHADQTNGWFVDGSAGTAHYKATVDGLSGTDSNTAFILNAGWRDQGLIGFEAGYTNLGSLSSTDGYGDHAKLKADGWTFGLDGHFNFNDNWYMSARTGGFQWKLKATLSVNDSYLGSATYRGSEESLGWYGGLGTGYDFNKHWSVGANFDYYSMNKHGYDIGTHIFSVSAEYRF